MSGSAAVNFKFEARSGQAYEQMMGRWSQADIWRQGGLRDVEQTSLTIRNEFANFEDYWQPYTTGEGGVPSQYISSLLEPKCVQLKEHLRRAYESNLPDGPRSFIMVAWACKGIVP
jgi:hypothetical protein